MSDAEPRELHVVILDADDLLRERILLPRLQDYGFQTTGVRTAEALHALLDVCPPNIVVIDVGLPDADGIDVAQAVHRRHPAVGVVMLTGRDDRADHVRGLMNGADAYLAKPVDVGLLAAMLHSLARRMTLWSPAAPVSAEQSMGRWRLEAGGWRLNAPCGGTVSLTRSERPLLTMLLQQPGQIVPRSALIATLTHDVLAFDPHRLDSMIHRLRRKIIAACGATLPLQSVHGEGYVFVP